MVPRWPLTLSVFLVFTLACAAYAMSPPPVRLAPSFSQVDLTPAIMVLEDKDARLTIRDVLKQPESAFRAITAQDRDIGYTPAAYWVRLRIENTGTQALDWLLDYEQTYTHTVELYQPTPQGYRQVSAGIARPYGERPYDAVTFVFPIHQAPGMSTYYVRLFSYNRIALLFKAWSTRAMQAHQTREYILMWTFYAFLLAMILYNMALFIFMRERSYLFYVFFLCTYLLFLMSFDGTAFKYLWPRAVAWESMALTVLLIVQNIFGMIFFQTFLHLKDFSKRYHAFLNVLIGLDVALVVWKLAAPTLPVYQYAQPVLLLTALTMIAIAIQLAAKGSRQAAYYLAALTILLVFAILNSLVALLVLPPSAFLHFGMHAGTCILAVLLSLGLADRINTMRIANQEGEHQYRTLFESGNDAILILEGETIVNCNLKSQEVFHCSPSQIVGQSVTRFLPPGQSDFTSQPNPLRGILYLQQSEPVAWQLCRSDGTVFPAEVSLKGLELHGKTLIQAVIRDISERKRFMDALSASEEKFSKSFQGAPLIMTITDRNDGRILDVNDTFTKVTGYTRSEALGRTFLELELYRNPEDRVHIMERLSAGATVRNYEIEMRTKSGQSVFMLISVDQLEIGGEHCLLAIISDISERKRAEDDLRASEETRHTLQAQLAQAQKMESIGRLAGGVAHDFNNLLTVILGYGSLMASPLEETDHANAERLQQVLKAAGRAQDLTRQLLAFGRKQVLDIKPVNLNTVISDFKEMLKRIIGEDIQLKTILAPDIGLVNADVSQIEQVLLNMVVNARDAMQQGGTISLQTSTVTLDRSYIASHAPVIPGTYVLFSISDSGSGMDAQTISQIFEPFFTTKGQGKGTGLGLAMVYGIVKQHGGYIWVYSEVGVGTTFKIYLPQLLVGTEPAIPPSVPPETFAGTETILVVEDDPEVRHLVSEMLREHGYTIIETGNARDALQQAAQRRTIDLVLTDVVMPDMSGRQVYESIAALRPDIKVLYMSGYTEDIIAHHGILDPGINFIQKPFTSQKLTQKIRAILAGNGGVSRNGPA